VATQVEVWRDGTAPCAAAVAALRSGGLLVYPTETVYGIGVALSAGVAGIERVRSAKRSPAGRSYLLLVAGQEQAFALWTEVPEPARLLAERHWPGPLTLVGRARPELPASLLGSAQVGNGRIATVSVRVPGDARIRELLDQLGEPLLSTSANVHGAEPPVDFAQIDLEALQPDLAINAGRCEGGLPSTLLSLAGPKPELLRQGPVQPELQS